MLGFRLNLLMGFCRFKTSISRSVRLYLELPATRRLLLMDVVICALVLSIALSVFWAPAETPDWSRFLGQARSLAGGDGYRTDGDLETYLPPGYSIFVALMLVVGLDEYIRLAQLIILFATAILVYGAVAHISRAWALPLGVIFSLNPMVSRLSGSLLSETIGAFLCASACFLLMRVLRRRHWVDGLFLGVVCVALLLTSPAAIFLAFVILSMALLVAMRSRRYVLAFAMALGGVTAMLPWQAHCVNATGNVCLLVYSTNPIRIASAKIDDSTLVHHWLRTWSLGERHIQVLHRNNPGAAPDWAFSRRSDKDLFPDGDERLRNGLSPVQREAISNDLAGKSSVSRLYLLTAVRSVTLWFDMRQIGHAQIGYVFPIGIARVLSSESAIHLLMRSAKVVFSSIVYILYITIPAFFLVVVWRSRLSKIWIVHGFFVSILFYTIITAYTAHNEQRRNAVFLPAMILAIAAGIHRSRWNEDNDLTLV